MCFGRVPPEINSWRMYNGSGSGSMVRAAVSWGELAAILRQTAIRYRAVTRDLAKSRDSPAAVAVSRAMAPYVVWLNATATHAAQAATQAATAASAHDLAMASLVPPDVIDANRERVTELSATNCLGQASPTIAALDGEYEHIWADDAEAMYAYARTSAKASALTPFSSPPTPVDMAELPCASAAVGRPSKALTSAADVVSNAKHVMATIPDALTKLSSSPRTTLDVHLLPATASLSKLSSLCPLSEVALKNLNNMNKQMMLLKAAALTLASKQSPASGSVIAAGFGNAQSIQSLSVPARWLTKTTSDPVIEERHCDWVPGPIRLVSAPATGPRRRPDCPRTSENHSGE